MQTLKVTKDKKVNGVTIKRISLFLIFIILTVLSLMIGADNNVTIGNLIKMDDTAGQTFIISRAPRTIAIILTASGLSIAGLIMQAISRNKFMSPSTSGTTDAAMLGVLLSYLLIGKQPHIIQVIFAFIFALCSTILFMTVLNKIKLRDAVYVPLVGMMYGAIIKAFTTAIAYHFGALQIVSIISLGTFNRFTNFNLLYIVLVPLFLSVIYATRFSIAGMGEDFSKGLGLNYKRTIFLGLCIIAVISAASFVTVGPITFVGLIIPNMVSAFYGDDVKKSIFDVAVLGAVFVLLCDIFSRLIIYPYEVAVGFTIGIVGGLIFLIILFRRIKYGKQ
ncbi:iron chelate uptake ABC transporter family permease subunit [Clostridium sp. D2Q-14]|uniref:ABC transporter permease n=1 Tax=Anaeromonas gelatinilytica TaxID=2683194 RepID=UPI00193B245B|nr:iron chelate uptake ABC transporter family permease subunit [Anaeromonas gelatinilytica]MBS4534039.1 iron chelate uptake ABC transporter family permease subunit [Anaeromonas gelatinilytica]